ncbi:MAG: methyltransferase domain-containing protein [Chloroflexota bacterium]|nr:methyltransferase domain-containing protein [Chloroflexota bacterium]
MRLGTYYRWLLSEFLGLLPESHERVLDVGCHDGYFLSRVTCRLKVAVDLEPDHAGFYPVWPADGRRLPFADETFERVYLLDVIEHVEDYGTILIEAVRVLRSGGTLWISTPSLHWWVVPPFLTWVLDWRWGHVRRGHTVEDIQAYLPPACQVTPTLWNMPYFRSFYFPVRVLWSLWPALGRRSLAWIARKDRHSPPGKAGHLFVRVTRPRSETMTKSQDQIA